MKFKFQTFLAFLLIAVAIIFGYAWLMAAAHDRDHDRDKPKDMSFAFQVKVDQGIRTMAELIAQEEKQLGRQLPIRENAPLCRLSISVVGPQNGTDLILPGSELPETDFIFRQGTVYEIPVSKEINQLLGSLRFRSNGVTNVAIYWAYCD